ncbi:LysR family transcriptional regulator [Natronospirillum operosum]|uniref:LysR family transcriptional regulator n=1 Tax=Natronospirillum operosum TaxID=2759953 RepID=UPI0030B7FC5A
MHWDDFETVLAIAETGSLSGAARRLSVSHATVFRRLGEIEQRLGVMLFERSRTGYTPTLAGEELADNARQMEAFVLSAERRIVGRDLQPTGAVWITTTDSMMAGLLAPLFAEFRTRYPGITLDVAVSNQLFNLTKREADVAIRPSNSPPDTLVGRKLVDLGMAVYGARGHVDAEALDLSQAAWVGPGSRLFDQPLIQWMSDHGYQDLCQFRVDTLIGMLSSVKAGLGVAVLPCYLADGDPDLVQLSDPIPSLSYGLWFLMHPDLRGVARISSLLEFMTEAVRAQRERLAGRPL